MRTLAAALVVCGLAVLPGCGGASKAGGSGAKHAVVMQLETSVGTTGAVAAWAAAVERLSHGTLRIEVRASDLSHTGHADFERRELARVRTGGVPLVAVGARVFDRLGVRSFQAPLAPMLIDGYDLEQKFLESSLPARALAGTERLGLQGVALVAGDMRRVLGVDRPFVTPEDFRGAVVGFQGGALADATVRALGGRPSPQGGEGSLRRLDAYEQQFAAISGNAYVRDAHYVSTVALWPRLLVVVASRHAYHRLSKAQRAALASAARAAIPAEIAAVRASDHEGLRALCSPTIRPSFHIVTPTPAQQARLRSAVAPVNAQLERDPATRSAITQIEAMKLTAKPDAPVRCAGAVEPSATVKTPIEGVYRRFDSAAVEAAREHVPLAYATPENWGAFVLVVHGDRFAATQTNAKSCTWAYGRLSVSGNRTIWDYIDGGGHAPSNAESKPGERMIARWSLYRAALTVAPITPSDIPPMTWRRTSRAPSSAALAAHCRPPANWDAR